MLQLITGVSLFDSRGSAEPVDLRNIIDASSFNNFERTYKNDMLLQKIGDEGDKEEVIFYVAKQNKTEYVRHIIKISSDDLSKFIFGGK